MIWQLGNLVLPTHQVRGLADREGRERFVVNCRVMILDCRRPLNICFRIRLGFLPTSAILPAFFDVFLVVTSHLRRETLYQVLINASLLDTLQNQH